jgi:hypothetical protein
VIEMSAAFVGAGVQHAARVVEPGRWEHVGGSGGGVGRVGACRGTARLRCAGSYVVGLTATDDEGGAGQSEGFAVVVG